MNWPEAVFFSILLIVGVPIGVWFLTVFTLLLFTNDVPDEFLMPWTAWRKR